MTTGNVVKLYYGNIVIITSVNDELTNWVSFDYENSSGATSNKTYTRKEMCINCSEYGFDSCCENCNGTEEVERTVHGMEEATFLASNVKDYILKRLTKNFEF